MDEESRFFGDRISVDRKESGKLSPPLRLWEVLCNTAGEKNTENDSPLWQKGRVSFKSVRRLEDTMKKNRFFKARESILPKNLEQECAREDFRSRARKSP